MSFECKYINDRHGLAKETSDLLEQIDAFSYPFLRPKYNTLGELHDTLVIEVTNSNRLDNDCAYIDRISIADIKARIKELKTEQEATESKNKELLRKMHETKDRNIQNQLERQIRHFQGEYEIECLNRELEKNCNRPDNYVVEIEYPYYRSGYYTRTGKDAKIVLKHTGWIYRIIYIYIHEMMHAFYDSTRLDNSPNSIEYVEEPLAEYGMLKFLDVFVQAHPEHSHLLYDAINSVNEKQYTIGLSHYAFGECLYQNYPHIEWEKLMLDAKNKVDVNSTEYKSLQAIFQTRPNKSNWDKAAQLLYDILTKANGKPSAQIAKQTKRKTTKRKTGSTHDSNSPFNIDKSTYDTWLKHLLESGILPSVKEMDEAMKNANSHGTSAAPAISGPSTVKVTYQSPYESFGPNYGLELEYNYDTDNLQYTIEGRNGSSKTLTTDEEQEIKTYLKNRQNIEDFFNKAYSTKPTILGAHYRSNSMSVVYGVRAKSVTNGEPKPWAAPFARLCSPY